MPPAPSNRGEEPLTVARYRILGWRGIPSLVEASDEGRSLQRPMSQRFQDLIDAVAVKEGASDSEAYLDGWSHGPEGERPGDAETVADAVVAELEAGFHDLLARRLLGRMTHERGHDGRTGDAPGGGWGGSG